MQTIELTVGTTIHRAARMLVAAAPARAVFNDIPIRARYATTRPEDIVNQYHWDDDIRCIRYQNSAEGRALQKRVENERTAAQSVINGCVARLPTLDMTDAHAVLAWIEEMADPVDHAGVTYDYAAIVATFESAGWRREMNCGEDLNFEEADNVAHYIVGQWLATMHPMVLKFIADWREKFPQIEQAASCHASTT